MSSSTFTVDSFPEFVAQNYDYSDTLAYHEGDRVAAAEEVRGSVQQLLRPFRDGGIEDKVLTTVLNDFVKAYPVGEDLDARMGALGIGMEREIADLLVDHLFSDMGAEVAALIKRDLNELDIWRDHGDISLYLVSLSRLIKNLRSTLDLDASATLLAAKDLCNGKSPASLMEAIEFWDEDSLDDEDCIYEDEDYDEEDEGLTEDEADLSKDFFKSLEAAKKVPDACVVMEGDWGGQIYLTCPARLVMCDEETLKKLLAKIDGAEWGCNEGDGSSLYFERVKKGGVTGGMGGGEVRDGLWIHGGIHPELAHLIKQVISGEVTLED